MLWGAVLPRVMEPNEPNGRREGPDQGADTTGKLSRVEEKVPEKRQLNWGLLLPLIAVVIAFAVGFVPMWRKAHGSAKERDVAQRQLRVVKLEALVASAAIDARRGEYEPARQSVSQFFTSLMEEVNAAAERSALTEGQKTQLQPLLQRRDDLITLLARSDPASVERLVDLYLEFRKAFTSPSEAPAQKAAPAA